MGQVLGYGGGTRNCKTLALSIRMLGKCEPNADEVKAKPFVAKMKKMMKKLTSEKGGGAVPYTVTHLPSDSSDPDDDGSGHPMARHASPAAPKVVLLPRGPVYDGSIDLLAPPNGTGGLCYFKKQTGVVPPRWTGKLPGNATHFNADRANWTNSKSLLYATPESPHVAGGRSPEAAELEVWRWLWSAANAGNIPGVPR